MASERDPAGILAAAHDGSDDRVAGDQGKLCRGQITVDHVQIRAGNGTNMDMPQNLSGIGRRWATVAQRNCPSGGSI
jgi:hypothetical protein